MSKLSFLTFCVLPALIAHHRPRPSLILASMASTSSLLITPPAPRSRISSPSWPCVLFVCVCARCVCVSVCVCVCMYVCVRVRELTRHAYVPSSGLLQCMCVVCMHVDVYMCGFLMASPCILALVRVCMRAYV